MFRKLDDRISVAGQITPDDVAEAARQGFTAVINNRPEQEQPGQPTGAEIEAAASAVGLSYRAIPVTPGQFTREMVAEMADALDAASGPVLAFCRSGTRSTLLWALARSSRGDDKETLAAKAEAAGYDLAPIQPLLG